MCGKFGEVTVIIGLVISFLAFRLTIIRISWHLNISLLNSPNFNLCPLIFKFSSNMSKFDLFQVFPRKGPNCMLVTALYKSLMSTTCTACSPIQPSWLRANLNVWGTWLNWTQAQRQQAFYYIPPATCTIKCHKYWPLMARKQHICKKWKYFCQE